VTGASVPDEEAFEVFRCGGQGVDADQLIDGFGRGQVMTDRADAAESLNQNRDFPVGAALNEAFKPAEFDDMEPGLLNPILFIQK